LLLFRLLVSTTHGDFHISPFLRVLQFDHKCLTGPFGLVSPAVRRLSAQESANTEAQTFVHSPNRIRTRDPRFLAIQCSTGFKLRGQFGSQYSCSLRYPHSQLFCISGLTKLHIHTMDCRLHDSQC
jgi:hypothetical protein